MAWLPLLGPEMRDNDDIQLQRPFPPRWRLRGGLAPCRFRDLTKWRAWGRSRDVEKALNTQDQLTFLSQLLSFWEHPGKTPRARHSQASGQLWAGAGQLGGSSCTWKAQPASGQGPQSIFAAEELRMSLEAARGPEPGLPGDKQNTGQTWTEIFTHTHTHTH